MPRDWDSFESILQLRDEPALVLATQAFARELGFDYHAYGARLSLADSCPATRVHEFGNFPDEWMRRHSVTRNRATDGSEQEQDDPRVQHVRAGLPVTPWLSTGRVGFTRADIGHRARSVLRLAGAHGMQGGVTVPLHSPGARWALMTFATSARSELRDFSPRLASLLLFASCLQVSVDRILGEPRHTAALSPREREVLHWAAAGKTSWEISHILHIAECTVNFHFQSAARRLQVKGRAAACSRAVALGQIAL
ncbi:MAG: LuxR C-terminal-related transcriptional regulator [Tahibacter sp.]